MFNTYPPDKIDQINDIMDTCLATAAYAPKVAIQCTINISHGALVFGSHISAAHPALIFDTHQCIVQVNVSGCNELQVFLDKDRAHFTVSKERPPDLATIMD